MLNADDLKNNHYLVQLIPYVFAVLSLVGLSFALTTNEAVCKAHLHRGLLLGWAAFMFPLFAGLQTPLGDAIAVAHTSVIVLVILPCNLIFASLESLRGRVTGSIDVDVKPELPRWETYKPVV